MLKTWTLGHVYARLVSDVRRIGAYMAKYATKEGRIRASVGYGDVERLLRRNFPGVVEKAFDALFRSGEAIAPWVRELEVTPWGLRCDFEALWFRLSWDETAPGQAVTLSSHDPPF